MILVNKILVAVIFMMFVGCSVSPRVAQKPLVKTEVDSFVPVAETVSALNEKYGSDQVLIVLDIDNTLLTSSVDLGGDIWYQWQRGKLAIKPRNNQKVKCLFEDAIGLLYELLPMDLTEKNLPTLIADWQLGGNTVFALTSRAPKYRPATERELNNKEIDFSASALAAKDQDAPVYRETLTREMSYMKGIMMTTGMNKGEMLSYILDKTQRQFSALIFVDYSEKNINNVYEEFKDVVQMDRNIYHYTRVEESRRKTNGAVLTDTQADKMADDWNTLNETLNAIFPKRNMGEACLSDN